MKKEEILVALKLRGGWVLFLLGAHSLVMRLGVSIPGGDYVLRIWGFMLDVSIILTVS